MRKTIFSLLMVFALSLTLAACGNPDTSETSNSTSTNSTSTSERQIAGTAIDLGAGTFGGGTNIQVGLYDVTPVDGQGNFIVHSSTGDLKVNEILDDTLSIGVAKVRVAISDGDEIQLISINKTHFEPVTTPFVTTVQEVYLYSGKWVVGEDIAAGSYKATASSGSGNFIVYDKNGMLITNEILGGSMGVAEVTVNLQDGDVIEIDSINQVDLTPVN